MAFLESFFCSDCKQEKQEARSVRSAGLFCSECREKRDKEQFYAQFKDFSDKQKLDWVLEWIRKHAQDFQDKLIG